MGRLPKWAEVYRCTHSAEAALRRLPEGSCWAERRLLRALAKRQEVDGGTAATAAMTMAGRWQEKTLKGGTWKEVTKEAFLGLPRTIRALYAHSYVDRLWNLAATERMALGLPLAPGELVYEASGCWVRMRQLRTFVGCCCRGLAQACSCRRIALAASCEAIWNMMGSMPTN